MKLTKRYYKTKEVADLFGLLASTVRYWETEFGKLHHDRASDGDRRFTQRSVKKISKIHDLLKVQGYTIKGAKRAIKC